MTDFKHEAKATHSISRPTTKPVSPLLNPPKDDGIAEKEMVTGFTEVLERMAKENMRMQSKVLNLVNTLIKQRETEDKPVVNNTQLAFDPYSDEIMDRLKDVSRASYIYKDSTRVDTSIGEVFVHMAGEATEIIYLNEKGKLVRHVMQGDGFALRTIVSKYDFTERKSIHIPE